MIDPRHITGLVLAGGRGSRMGGVDKGLQPHVGEPLVLHALRRLGPQVGTLMINANRHLEAYEAIAEATGAMVWPDTLADYPGPLAGVLAGLARCETPWLVSVPCDSPRFPRDLVARIGDAITDADADLAIAATREPSGRLQTHPVFCLMRADLRDSLQRFIDRGERKFGAWTASHRFVEVVFDDADAFANANTVDELRRLADHV